jgi:tetratricopeptide (TPR) repeat protein
MGLAIEQHLKAAIIAYHQALEGYTREQLPQQWAMTQNNLGAVLQEQGTRTGGEAGARLLAEAVTAYRHALEVRTLETLPLQWAQTQNNLAQAYAHLEDWANAAASYTYVLQVYPDYKEAYQTAAYLYHEMLFKFPEAFALNEKWLARHPDDLSALSDSRRRTLRPVVLPSVNSELTIFWRTLPSSLTSTLQCGLSRLPTYSLLTKLS